MPNARFHARVAAPAGAFTAAGFARQEGGLDFATEALAGWFGGRFGGKLPDIFDPSTRGPRHRSLAHGVLPIGSLITVLFEKLAEVQLYLRTAAHDLRTRAKQSLSSLAAFLQQLGAAALHLLSGFLAGILGGYLSHLLLDSLTPNGLPLVC